MAEDAFDRFDGLGNRLGTPACAACGALFCIAHRGERQPAPGMIRDKLLPEPAGDVEWVQCGGCGASIATKSEVAE